MENNKNILATLCKVTDAERLCRFIYKFLIQIYRIRYTLDWHSYIHIFFPSAWVYGKNFSDENGEHKEGELAKIIQYHAKVRDCKPMAYYKGQDQYSEQYGAVEAEYSPNNKVRLDILNIFENPSLVRIYLAGQAESHCFIRTLQQVVKHFANRPDILSKIVVLEDCMSCIGGFEQVTAEKMEEIKRMGVKFVKSTDITDLYAAE